MPASLPSAAGTTPRGSILLIEEYDALAVAIGSALKKFAPRHATSVARSIAEARVLADQIAPDLFVIDFDPPYSGITEFLHEMQNARPDARALIIAPGISHEIATECRAHGALQFIEKRFEVADFGAAVQALLGPWREAESATSRGTLRHLGLPDIVVLHCASGSSALLKVNASGDRAGDIHVVDGQIFHAETGKLRGEAALDEMLSWPRARMREAGKPAPTPRTIHGAWAPVFFEVRRRAKFASPSSIPPSENASQEKSSPKPGKKIVVIDDTEMLLIFVEDVLATAEPNLQITTALKGTSGMKEIARVLPDLVILDYSLPDLNGDEICRRLLQDERTAHVPVLMMSGHVPEMTAAAARLDNVVATIAKPFFSDELVDLVRRILTAEPLPASVSVETITPGSAAAVAAADLLRDETKQPADGKYRSKSPPAVVSAQPSKQPEPGTTAPKAPTFSAPVISDGRHDVVLGLFLEVVSMQFTPQLQMGAVRARLSSFTVSLHVPSAALRETLPLKTGFQLGRTELDGNGQITIVRLIPTLQPFQPAQMRNAFEIADVTIVPAHARDGVELIPAAAATMTMQLLAHLELAGVELSSSFEIAQLILKWRSNSVRVTLSSNAVTSEKSGTAFETAAVQLDNSARIAEMLLNRIR